ncbi:MAG: extracellular solute-binding protein [Caldilineaceae bacterium]|nr:extracellular solute-binding protein [Caldilineaceae bacterium]
MAHSSLSRRRFLHISGAAVSALALAACVPTVAPSAPAEGEAAASGAAVVSEDTPLWVLHTNDFHPDYNDFIRKTIVDFATEKGWALEVADTAGFLGGSADIQKIAASVQSGDAPDLWMHTVNIFQMKQLETVVPVTDIVNELIATYGEIAPRMRKAAETDGDFYGVPFHVRSDGGWARRDIFEAAGIDINALRTYDELREACLEVSDPAAEMWGWGMTVNRGGDGGYLIARVLNGWGATWTDETGQFVTIDSPEAVTAVEWLVDTYTNPQWERMLPPGVLSWTDPTNNESYLGGKVAYTQNAGTVYAKAVVDANPVAELTLYDPPKGGPVLETFNGLGGMNWLKIREGKNPAAADELLMHFFTEEILKQVYTVATAYAVPAYESMWEWEEITSVPQSVAQKVAALDPVGWNGLSYPGPSSAQMGAVDTSNVHTDMVASVLTGAATAEEAVKQAAERSIQIFQEFGAPGVA